jgi:hypothetical protein
MPKKREILQEITFNERGKGTYHNMYTAQEWLYKSGFLFGSLDRTFDPIAFQKGRYALPEKWHRFTVKDKASIDGIITSNDWREGEVKVIIYK